MFFHKQVSETGQRIGKEPDSHHANPAKFDGHVRIYPTLACNLRCEYCVNEQMGRRPKRHTPASPDAWCAAINREGRHVVLTGGEPFLYPDLPALINGVTNDLKVRAYTNFCLDLRTSLDRITRPVHFYISWHPQQRTDRELFLANILHLQDNLLFTANVHAIDAKETRHALAKDLDFFEGRGLSITRDADQRIFEGACRKELRTAVCSKTIYLIGPDGTRFQCVSRMVRGDRPMENMLQERLDTQESVSVCPDFGRCAPCDILGETRMTVF